RCTQRFTTSALLCVHRVSAANFSPETTRIGRPSLNSKITETEMKNLLCLLCSFLMLSAAHATPSTAITLDDFKLVAELSADRASFTLTATARVEDRKGGCLDLLSGPVALTELGPHPKWQLHAEQNRFILTFDRSGKFPIQ